MNKPPFDKSFLDALNLKEQACVTFLYCRKFTHKEIAKRLYFDTYRGYQKLLARLRKKIKAYQTERMSAGL